MSCESPGKSCVLTDLQGHTCDAVDGLFMVQGEHCDDFNIGDAGTLVIQVHPSDKSKFRVGWACC